MTKGIVAEFARIRVGETIEGTRILANSATCRTSQNNYTSDAV